MAVFTAVTGLLSTEAVCLKINFVLIFGGY